MLSSHMGARLALNKLLQGLAPHLLVSAPLHVPRQVERPYRFRAHAGHRRGHVGTARQPQALLREQHALQAGNSWQSIWVPEQTALGSSLPSIGTTEGAECPAGTYCRVQSRRAGALSWSQSAPAGDHHDM